jgi:hypothetical protein
MTAIAEGTSRAEKIEQYILREALNLFLVNLRQPGSGVGVDLFEGILSDGRGAYGNGVSYDDVPYEFSKAWFNELWPEDDDVETDEHRLAAARVDLLVMQMFSAVARNSDALNALSFYFGNNAGEGFSKLMPGWGRAGVAA